MMVVLFEVNGQVQMDGFPDNVKIFNKEGFIKVNDQHNNLLSLYNPARIIAIRKVDAVPPKPLNEPEENAETVHPGNGTKEQPDSADR